MMKGSRVGQQVMSKTRRTQVILLLADGFDEAAVSVILTALRQIGLAVTVVGLRARRVSGAHGLTIVPNTSLDRLLGESLSISALILPGGLGYLSRLQIDPRVSTLLQQTMGQEALLVSLSNPVTQMIRDLAQVKGQQVKVIEPKAEMYLEAFAEVLAAQLVGQK